MTKMIEIYEVIADAATGEWIGEPTSTGEKIDIAAWSKKADTALAHYDTYEVPTFDDAGDRVGDETRAIVVTWA